MRLFPYQMKEGLVTGEDDSVGLPLWPSLVQRLLSQQFLTTSQLADQIGISEDQAEEVADTLIKQGLLQPWLAPECPKCAAVWAAFLGEDDIPKSIRCPFCGGVSPEEDVGFFQVYERLKD